jgi:hypothetical protein
VLRKANDVELASAKTRLKDFEKDLEKYHVQWAELNLDLPIPGEAEKALESFLLSIKVCRQAYFGGAFVGGHVEKLLKILPALWAALRKAAFKMDPPPLRQFFFVAASVAGLDGAALSSEPSVPRTQRRAATTPAAARPVLAPPAAPCWNCKRTLESTIAVEAIIARMQPVWEHFEKFHHECWKTRLLTDEEIEALCKAATGFVDCVRVSYPDNNIELKLHLIEAHVPQYVRKWRSAGLSLEDGIEHLHAVDNRLSRRFACLHGARKTRSRSEALVIFQRPDLGALSASHLSRRRRRFTTQRAASRIE